VSETRLLVPLAKTGLAVSRHWRRPRSVACKGSPVVSFDPRWWDEFKVRRQRAWSPPGEARPGPAHGATGRQPGSSRDHHQGAAAGPCPRWYRVYGTVRAGEVGDCPLCVAPCCPQLTQSEQRRLCADCSKAGGANLRRALIQRYLLTFRWPSGRVAPRTTVLLEPAPLRPHQLKPLFRALEIHCILA
jgi:hypothetical protein